MVSIICVIILFCFVSEENGGYARLDGGGGGSTTKYQSNQKAATGNDIPAPNSDQNFEQPQHQNFGQGVQNFANRMSYRMGFTPINGQQQQQDPYFGQPNNQVAPGGFDNTGGLPQPNSGMNGGGGGGMFNRMSMKMKQAFGGVPQPNAGVQRSVGSPNVATGKRGRKVKKQNSGLGGGSPSPGGAPSFLGEIGGNKKLNKVQTVDRSGPQLAGRVV